MNTHVNQIVLARFIDCKSKQTRILLHIYTFVQDRYYIKQTMRQYYFKLYQTYQINYYNSFAKFTIWYVKILPGFTLILTPSIFWISILVLTSGSWRNLAMTTGTLSVSDRSWLLPVTWNKATVAWINTHSETLLFDHLRIKATSLQCKETWF